MFSQPDFKNIRKILIISSSWLGDAVLTVPTICGIRNSFPGAWMSVLAKDTIADMFYSVPDIDEVIPFHKGRGIKKVFSVCSISQLIKKKKFDLAVIFPRSIGTAVIPFLGGVARRIGFSSGLRGMLLTRSVKRPRKLCSVHQVQYYSELLKVFGEVNMPKLPSLDVPEREKIWAHNLMDSFNAAQHDFTVGINPGATYGEAKQWIPERFAELAVSLAEKYNCRIVMFGDRKIPGIAQTVGSGRSSSIVDLTGKTSILQLAAILRLCDVLVTNDTGPMHVACAVKTPVVAIFGPTATSTTSPVGSSSVVITNRIICSPCLRRVCPEGHHRCMVSIRTEEVEKAVVELLENCK